MAVREVFSLIQANEKLAATTQMQAGNAVARDGGGLLVYADRALHTRGNYVGVLADDTSRTGNTIIGVDPVGATFLDGNGVLQDYANGLFSATRRAIADYQDETVTNVSNLVDSVNGFAGPRRGAAVYTSPSTVLETDEIAAVKTGDTTGPYTAVDTPFSGGDAFNSGDLLSYGTAANAGKFVKVTDATKTLAVARFDKWADAGQKVARITLLV